MKHSPGLCSPYYKMSSDEIQRMGLFVVIKEEMEKPSARLDRIDKETMNLYLKGVNSK